MELIINLPHDCLGYCRETGIGTFEDHRLFGYQDFKITEFEDGFTIDISNDDGYLWTYKCKFTDHGNRLVVKI